MFAMKSDSEKNSDKCLFEDRMYCTRLQFHQVIIRHSAMALAYSFS